MVYNLKMLSKSSKKQLTVFLFFIILFVSGCRQKTANSVENKSNRNENGNSENKSAAKIKLFNGKGVVTKINLELGSVELDHEAIEGAMPAMIMEFYVKEISEIEVLKVGDKVEFVLEENFGQEKIISIKKIQ